MKPRIVFMGTPEFAVPSLKKLIQLKYPVVGVVCQPDRPQGRSGSMRKLPVAQLAERHGIPVLQPEKVRSVRFEQDLASLKPELVVTAAYGRILPANILQLPALGCINIHASLLPAYRGAAPIQWALIDGRQKTGVTFMLMDEGMDTGDILRQADLELDQTIDGGQLSEQLAQLGAQILPQVITDFLAGKIEPRPQDLREEQVRSTCRDLTSALRARQEDSEPFQSVELMAPAKAPLYKIKDRFRWRIILKGKSSDLLMQYIMPVTDRFQFGQVTIAIDSDPYQLW